MHREIDEESKIGLKLNVNMFEVYKVNAAIGLTYTYSWVSILSWVRILSWVSILSWVRIPNWVSILNWVLIPNWVSILSWVLILSWVSILSWVRFSLIELVYLVEYVYLIESVYLVEYVYLVESVYLVEYVYLVESVYLVEYVYLVESVYLVEYVYLVEWVSRGSKLYVFVTCVVTPIMYLLMLSFSHILQIQKAKLVGCSIRPACTGNAVVACVFSDERKVVIDTGYNSFTNNICIVWRNVIYIFVLFI